MKARDFSPVGLSLTWCARMPGWWTCTSPSLTWASWSAALHLGTLLTGETLNKVGRHMIHHSAAVLTRDRCSDLVFSCRFGRRLSFFLSNVLNLTAGLIVAVLPNYVSILVLRSFFGFGVKGGWMTSYVLRNDFPALFDSFSSFYILNSDFSCGKLLHPCLIWSCTV